VKLYPGRETVLAPGQYRIHGRLRLPPPADNPGQFDVRDYNLRLGLVADLGASRTECLREDRWNLSAFLMHAAEHCRARISEMLAVDLADRPDERTIILAMALGTIGEDGKEYRPIMLHRVILGSVERFTGALIEHFGGDFPVWLAPEQVRLVPITDRVNDYGAQLLAQLKAAGVRAKLDEQSDKLGAKIRRAEIDKVPYTLVLGSKEAETQSISVRSRAKGDEGIMPFADYLARLKTEIATRALAVKTAKPAAPGAAPAN
jgi:hypothetical protein